MKTGALAFLSFALVAAFLAAQTPPLLRPGQVQASPPQTAEELRDFPQALISNGTVHVTLYLPDTEKGYYRATRFDWSGVIPSLLYQGHNYFGQWFDRYDPKINDAIMGPVEEFGNTALGFNEAAPGGTFVKVGVGALKKPDNGRPYNHATTYDIVDSGKWSVRKGPDFVEFTQELTDAAGYAYVYRKTVRLAKDKPVLSLEHSLKNTGQKIIETSVYEHNFYMLDGKPTGPDYVVKFPFEVHWAGPASQLTETNGKELHFLKEYQQGQTAQSNLTGYGLGAADYDMRVENRRLGAGVRQTSDRPIARINFWSIRATLCPEAYIDLKVEPGQETTWRINYEFYTFPPAN
jgi:hypothetical protein